MGEAMARGIAFDDFRRMRPVELEAFFVASNRRDGDEEKTDWERTRVLGAICVQPHLTQKITPQSLLPLPWDGENNTAAVPMPSKAERLRRAYELINS